jgi:hypothetical protein
MPTGKGQPGGGWTFGLALYEGVALDSHTGISWALCVCLFPEGWTFPSSFLDIHPSSLARSSGHWREEQIAHFAVAVPSVASGTSDSFFRPVCLSACLPSPGSRLSFCCCWLPQTWEQLHPACAAHMSRLKPEAFCRNPDLLLSLCFCFSRG